MVGQAILEVTVNENNVQVSNFGENSFQITNTGSKTIARINLDVSTALYPDSVFDPFGLAGDTTSKPFTIDRNDDTGIISPQISAFSGGGGRSGYRGLRLDFDNSLNGGFEPGETLGFSIDMDPNSVAGTEKAPLDAGSNPGWDVGGVSGAELIGSTFTVTFTDGSTAVGQLQGVGNEGGSRGIADENSPNLQASLEVNGFEAGNIGAYDTDDPVVIVNAPIGQTIRVVLTKGFVQPVNPYASFLAEQLEKLTGANFPANNAVEFQTVDIVITEANQDISDLFVFDNVASYNFAGEDRIPLGFVASVIDPENNNLPLGALTQPIYLQFSDTPIDENGNNGGGDPGGDDRNDVNNLLVEAENISDLSGYRLEDNDLASNGKLLALIANESNIGSASFDFAGETGNYHLILGTYDENDGKGAIQVAQNDDRLGGILLEKDLQSGGISANNRVRQVVATDVFITEGDRFTVTGIKDGEEYVRFDYIEFVPQKKDLIAPETAAPAAININFGSATAEPIAGFILDTGAAYSSQQGYGWVTQSSVGSDNATPLDIVANGRDRDTLFNSETESYGLPTRDSLIHLQYPTGLANSRNNVLTPAAWEYDLPNGSYEVTVGVGDLDYFDSIHTINVEQTALIDGFIPTGSDSQAVTSATGIFEVDDGRLTIDAVGGRNTKINFISILSV